jgi:hypothetical protein
MSNLYIEHFSSMGESELQEVKKKCDGRGVRQDVHAHCPDNAAEQLDAMLHGVSDDHAKQGGNDNGDEEETHKPVDNSTTASFASFSRSPDTVDRDYPDKPKWFKDRIALLRRSAELHRQTAAL